MFSFERHRKKESSILNTRKFRFKFEIMNDIKVGGRWKKLVVGIISDKTEIK